MHRLKLKLTFLSKIVLTGSAVVTMEACQTTAVHMKPSKLPNEVIADIVDFIPNYCLRTIDLPSTTGYLSKFDTYAMIKRAKGYAAAYFPEGNGRSANTFYYYALCEKFIREKNKAGIYLLFTHLASPLNLNDTAVLHNAVTYGSPIIISLLLDKKANAINSHEAKNLDSPLHKAVKAQHKDIVILLMEKGININSQNKAGNMPLHLSTDQDITQLLIDHHADINGLNVRDETPLQLAIRHMNEKMVSLLLSNGADPNRQDVDGNTTLHLISKKCKGEKPTSIPARILKKLLDLPTIDRNIRNLQYQTPISPGDEELRRLIQLI